MLRFLKWLGIIILALVLIIGITVMVLSNKGENVIAKTYDVNPTEISIPTDSASLARGAHFSNILCGDCHSPTFEGKKFFDAPELAVVWSPNLTSGVGGIGSDYSSTDWVRAIRHGVAKDGHGLFIMPSKDMTHMSQNDIASIVAYMQTLPARDNEPGESEYGMMGKILTALGAFGDIIAAEVIDHEAPYPPEPNIGTSADYGKYLVDGFGCRSCHQPELNGGQTPEPGSPFSPNITPGGNISNWSLEDFSRTMRSGKTPEGLEMDPLYMPWKSYGQFDDEEMEAVYNYLTSLEAKETTTVQ